MRNARKVERAKYRVEVGCEGIVVISNRGLAGSAETATIVSDHAMAGGQ
jgi:hypothetical protein